MHNPNRYQTADIIINQTDLTSKVYDPFGFKHTFVTGFELSREDVTQQSFAPALPNIDKSLFDPNPNLGGYPSGYTSPINRVLTTQAIYALDTVQLDRHWIVNGGVRLDNYERNDTGPFNANPNNNPNGSAHDVLFNWNAGIVYKPVEIGSIYLAYATSSNPVGGELDATGADYGGLSVALAQLRRRRTRPGNSAPSGSCSTDTCSLQPPYSRPSRRTRAKARPSEALTRQPQ